MLDAAIAITLAVIGTTHLRSLLAWL